MDIQAAKQRCEAATAEPWVPCAHVAGTDPDCPCKYYGDVWGEDGETIVAFLGTCSVCPGDGCGCRTAPVVHDEMQRRANGMFIAHARTDLPAALEALEKAQGQRDELRKALLALSWQEPDGTRHWCESAAQGESDIRVNDCNCDEGRALLRSTKEDE